MSRSVVITGVGAVTPLGVGARTLHERWSAGRSGIEDGLGRCDEFEAKEHLSVKEVRRSDRFTQLALTAAGEAIADAGWDDGAPADPDRSACVIGTGIGGITTIEEQHTIMQERGPGEGLAARHPDPDGQRRQRGGLDEARPARPVVRHRVRVLGRRARDRDRRAADRLRRRRQRRGGRHGVHAHAAHDRGLLEDGGAVEGRASRARSTAAATASCSARARACWCSRRRSTRASAARACWAGWPGTRPPPTPTTSPRPSPTGRGAARAIELALADAGADARRTWPT